MARVLITIPDKLLKQVDRRAKAEYESRSSYLRELIVDELKYTQMPNPRIVDETAGIWGSSFPSGTSYVNRLRKQWAKRTTGY